MQKGQSPVNLFVCCLCSRPHAWEGSIMLTAEITCHPNKKHHPEVVILLEQAIMAVAVTKFAVSSAKEIN